MNGFAELQKFFLMRYQIYPENLKINKFYKFLIIQNTFVVFLIFFQTLKNLENFKKN